MLRPGDRADSGFNSGTVVERGRLFVSRHETEKDCLSPAETYWLDDFSSFGSFGSFFFGMIPVITVVTFCGMTAGGLAAGTVG